ncbi:MAG: hypothetical protein A2V67_01760 [Deltaproteobacteria bacterium RBG_13_61_14]|nr:MAG: hypothetical protein A2V67_01760 [Deltaproteobacteria bacterium RBG_13_61_14]
MPERRHDLDWLRIFAVLLLIYFHSARIFDFDPFYVKNQVTSFGLAAFIVFVNQWHMQLFILIAGASTFYALGFRSGAHYAKERFLRLFVPFVFGTAVIVPPQCYYTLLRNPAYQDSYLQFLPHFFDIDPATAGGYRGTFEWGHLWFILYLFTFSLLALPLFLFLRRETGRQATARLAAWTAKGRRLLCWALPLVLIEGALRPGWPGRQQNLYNDWANFVSYLTYFIYGYILSSDPRFGRAVDRSWKTALALALALFAVLFWAMATDHDPPRGYTPGFILFMLVLGFHSWFWLVAILGAGRKYLNFYHRALAYANPAAYPFYILHQTVIVVIGFYVVKWSAGVPLKYLVITTAALVATILIYDLAVRRANVTRALFGMKPLGGKS